MKYKAGRGLAGHGSVRTAWNGVAVVARRGTTQRGAARRCTARRGSDWQSWPVWVRLVLVGCGKSSLGMAGGGLL